MPTPILKVSSVEVSDQTINIGTIMEHNEPPSLLAMVTKTDLTGEAFDGVCLNDGVYIGNGGWFYKEFHIFKGEVTLSQL